MLTVVLTAWHFVYLHLMNKFVLFLIGIFAVACTEISYKEPQPRGIQALTKIPSSLHGVYLMDNDTVTFFENGLRGKENGKEEVLTLSDSIVLKKYKKHYFISYRDGNVWLLRILRKDKNGDLYFMEMDHVPDDEAQRKIFLDKLSAEIPVIRSDPHYIIDPSPKELYRLIKKGYFKDDGVPGLKRIR